MSKRYTGVQIGVISSWTIATKVCPNGHRMCLVARCWLTPKKGGKKKHGRRT